MLLLGYDSANPSLLAIFFGNESKRNARLRLQRETESEYSSRASSRLYLQGHLEVEVDHSRCLPAPDLGDMSHMILLQLTETVAATCFVSTVFDEVMVLHLPNRHCSNNLHGPAGCFRRMLCRKTNV
jgi:hypothetical protein